MRSIPVLLVFFLAAAFGNAQVTDRPSDLLVDLQAYAHVIRSLHINPFTSISEADLVERITSLEGRIGEVSNDRFLTELMTLNALVNDEHTMVHPVHTHQLPFLFRTVEEGVVIVATDQAHTDHLMSRVLMVNGHPISEVIDAYAPLIMQVQAGLSPYSHSIGF